MGLKKAKKKVVKPIKRAPQEFKRVMYFDDRYYKVILGIRKKVTKFFPSVTTILDIIRKPYIENWKVTVGVKESTRITSEALRKGSNVHYGAEVLALGGICVFRPEDNPFSYQDLVGLEKKYGLVYRVPDQNVFLQINRIYDWMKTLDVQIHSVEETVYHKRHEYAGTMDLVVDIPEDGNYPIAGATPMFVKAGRYLVDWKTGKSAESRDYLRQLSAYYKGYKHLHPKEQIDGAFLVHSNAKTKSGIVGINTKFLDVDTMEFLFKEFLAIKTVYMLENPTPTYKELDFPEYLTRSDKDPYQLELL